MKILFVMRHSGYVRNFESTLRLLCERGHTVQLAFQMTGTHKLLDPADVSQQIADKHPRFTRSVIPFRHDALGYAARELRLGLDYLRYLAPAYEHAPKLRERAEKDVPEALVRRTKTGILRSTAGRSLQAWWLRMLHQAVPTDAHIDAFLTANRPDVLAVTPLIEPGAPQAEYVRSARALGIPIALCVASWDNLTNKGIIHGPVDLVVVWNEMMKEEAIRFHDIPPERVVVTGAQPFDHWFDWQPSRTRDAWCCAAGLPGDRPYLLYLCSSRFIAPHEVPFIREWVRQLRSSTSPVLRDIGVLIRPHPQNADQWRDVDMSDCGPVVVHPRAGATPSEDKSRSDYFDSIYHSAGVVGINTTGEIESAIIGRNVFTILAPEFRDTQEGTLHFEHLRSVNGGLVHVGETFPDHLAQLAATLESQDTGSAKARRFVEAFVRPLGIDKPATPRVVRALEVLAKESRTQPAPPRFAPLARLLLSGHGERLRREALLETESKAARRRAQHRREAQAAHERAQ